MSRRSELPTRPVRAALLLLGLVCLPTLAAEPLRYEWEIPGGDSVSYTIEVPVAHPGTLVIDAEWEAPRQISFRLIRPGAYTATARRTGISPLHMEVAVEPGQVGGEPWLLTLHSLPSREAGQARLTIELPDPDGVPREETAPEKPTRLIELIDEPEPEPTPWMDPVRTPRGVAAEVASVFDTTERLRHSVRAAVDSGQEDACRWQSEMLRFLAAERDRLGEGGEPAAYETRELLGRMAEAIRKVDGLRSTTDPVLAGAPPEDRSLHEAWGRLRQARLEPLEGELDNLLSVIQRDHAPELKEQEWPARLISCVTACERHFEESLVGGPARSVNRHLAAVQWERILAAADAMEALNACAGEESIRLSSR